MNLAFNFKIWNTETLEIKQFNKYLCLMRDTCNSTKDIYRIVYGTALDGHKIFHLGCLSVLKCIHVLNLNVIRGLNHFKCDFVRK